MKIEINENQRLFFIRLFFIRSVKNAIQHLETNNPTVKWRNERISEYKDLLARLEMNK